MRWLGPRSSSCSSSARLGSTAVHTWSSCGTDCLRAVWGQGDGLFCPGGVVGSPFLETNCVHIGGRAQIDQAGPFQERAMVGRGQRETGWTLWSSSLAVEELSRVVRPMTEEAASLCVALGSRTRNSGNIWDKSGITFQAGCLVMQWVAWWGGGGGWLVCVQQSHSEHWGELEIAQCLTWCKA